MQRVSPGSEGSESHTGLHSPRVLHCEDKTPEYPALKVSKACLLTRGPEGCRKNWSSPCVCRCWWHVFWGYHKDTGANKSHFGVLFLAYSPRGLPDQQRARATLAFWMMRNKGQRVSIPSHLSQNHIRSAEIRKITQLILE